MTSIKPGVLKGMTSHSSEESADYLVFWSSQQFGGQVANILPTGNLSLAHLGTIVDNEWMDGICKTRILCPP